MDKEQSSALFQQGKKVWNAWAKEMLAERKRLEDQGRWSLDLSADGFSQEAKNWQKNARVDFSELNFGSDVNFENFIFPGTAEFRKVKFAGNALFDGVTFAGNAQFCGAKFAGEALFGRVTFSGDARFEKITFFSDAWFRKAEFSGIARFDEANFSSNAWFNDATFSGDARFDEAKFSFNAWFNAAQFSGIAWYDAAQFCSNAGFDAVQFSNNAWFFQCHFGGSTSFNQTAFKKSAQFGAIDAKTAFTLASAQFSEVPGFIQAHFAEAPRLDEIHLRTRGFWSSTLQFFKDGQKPDPEYEARWRALKRLAVQGHDHQNEQLFFRSELLARQWHSVKPRHAAFWFSIIYQLLSDFGGSLLRPFGWWVLSLFVFAGVYLAEHPDIASGNRSTFGVVYDRLAPWETQLNPLACRNGSSDPVLAALDLSVRNALLFVGQTSRDELQKNYSCLYAKHTNPVLIVPKSVIFWEHLQNVLSVILIFLFLLGVRNHFKIK